MAYTVNDKIYTDHALMDEMVLSCKKILNGIILKDQKAADNAETEESMLLSDYLMLIDKGTMTLDVMPLTEDMLTSFGYSAVQAQLILADLSNVPEQDKDKLLKHCCDYFIDNYVEFNNYYRALNGLPYYGTTEYDIYVDSRDPRLYADDGNTDFNFSQPIHEYSVDEINTLESLGIISNIRDEHPGSKYKYLDFLGSKKIDILTARKAANWDILFMPAVEPLVESRFKELYIINRDMYQANTYSLAYTEQSKYYEQLVSIMILAETFSNMITDIPEWYIRRDIFDIRSVQYFLESKGVKFFKNIPLKYQIKIVKNLNKLIKYKSTNKNISDILEIFAIDDIKIYKYYLYKNLAKKNRYIDLDPSEEPGDWLLDDYEFGDEETDEWAPSEYISKFEGIDEEDPGIPDTKYVYDFTYEDADEVIDSEDSDRYEEMREANRDITDEFGNHYALEFVQVPIGESFDKYIKDDIYRKDYEAVVLEDKYWDGEDVHSLVRNRHLERDQFSWESTKYMFVDYKVSTKKYQAQMSFFMSLIFNTDYNINDIKISIPAINATTQFGMLDVCILIYCMSQAYAQKNIAIRTPKINKGERPNSGYYIEANGGFFYDGKGEYPPDPYHGKPKPWSLEDLDFGDEEYNSISYDPLYGEMYDFGYNTQIDKNADRIFDYGEVGVDEFDFDPEPEPEPVVEPTDDWWEAEESGCYTEEYDGGKINPYKPIKDKFRFNLDGGKGVRYSEFNKEYFYDYLTTDHPELFISLVGRLKGMNLNVDLEKLNEQISSIRHSKYNFKRGMTLKDVHADEYKSLNGGKLNSVSDLMNIFSNNMRVFEKMYKYISEDISSRDELVIARYVFNTLFTVPYNDKLYRLKDGNIAESFDQILRERNYSLYKFYNTLMQEKDTEVRLDNIRNVLNDIVNTLEYYIKSDDTNYVFSFVSTFSMEAITRYVTLLINFFKSWKVHFLDPHTSYIIDDKVDNGIHSPIDGIKEIKISRWDSDRAPITDSMVLNIKRIFDDKHVSLAKEKVEMYAYRQDSPLDEYVFDGEHYNSYLNTNINDELNHLIYDGDNPDFNGLKKYYSDNIYSIGLYAVLNDSSNTIVSILDLDDPTYESPITGRLKDQDILCTVEFIKLNGGNVTEPKQDTVNVNAGNVAHRTDTNDLDGGGVLNGKNYLTVNGHHIYVDQANYYPLDNKGKVISYDVDAGYVASGVRSTRTIKTTIENNSVSGDIRLSSYKSNCIKELEDGLFLDGEGKLASKSEYDSLVNLLKSEKQEYVSDLREKNNRVDFYSNEERITNNVNSLFDDTFDKGKSVLNRYRRNSIAKDARGVIDDSRDELNTWFDELEVYEWKSF